MKAKIEIFYSYAHEDEVWRNKLEKHLSVLKRERLIIGWYDRKIIPGMEWAKEIDTHLNTSHIILLLVSPDFIASDYCWGIELKRAIKRHNDREARVIPIIIRPVDWTGAPFKKLQVLPKDGKPVTSWQNTDEALLSITQGIRNAIEELTNKDMTISSNPAKTKSAIRKKISQHLQVWNVPFRRNPIFTNRENILTNICDMLTSNKTAAITQLQAFSGLGGIGKTQAAVEYAYRYRYDYQTILWVKADSREELISDFVAIADLLNLPEKDAQDQNLVVNAVKRWLETHTDWLLIFDNADELITVCDFLPLENKGHILLTTRAHAMSGLARKVEIEKMDPENGALFLLRRANIITLVTSFNDVSNADRAIAEEISEELDGLPLALDQAGAYIEETRCSLYTYLDLYRTRRTALLKRRGGLISDHPEPVATTWSLSFEKIEQANPDAANLLRLCAFLSPDAIPEELISEGVTELSSIFHVRTADPLELNAAIAELLRYSLVSRDSKAKTLTIHRLVQAVLKDGMDMDTQHQWAEFTIRVVNLVFPKVEFSTWPRCQKYLPHVQVCISLIQQWKIISTAGAQLLNRAGRYLHERAQYTEAEILLRVAQDIYERSLGLKHPDVATNLNNLADLYREQGHYVLAEPLYQRALTIRQETLGTEHPDTSNSFHTLAMLYDIQGKYDQAEPLFQQVLTIRERTLGPEHPDVASSLNALAILYDTEGRYTQAEPLYQRALIIRKRTLGPEHPDVASSLNNLAILYDNQGKYDQAEPLLQQALEIRERTLGPEHPDVASSLNNLAILYDNQGKYDQAEPLYQRALDIRKTTLGLEHPDVAQSLNNLARIYDNQGQYDRAEPFYLQALNIWEHALGPEHPDVAMSLNNLAVLYYNQGKYSQAEPLLQRALATYEQMLGPDHPNVALSLNSLAELYNKQGEYSQVEPLLQRALVIIQKAFGPEHPSMAQILENYAILLRNTRREDEAARLEAKARVIQAKFSFSEQEDTTKFGE